MTNPSFPDPFFPEIEPIGFAGSDCTDELAYRHYDAERMIAGKSMRDHLRIAVCYWHSFSSPGSDVFGAGTFDPDRQLSDAQLRQCAMALEGT